MDSSLPPPPYTKENSPVDGGPQLRVNRKPVPVQASSSTGTQRESSKGSRYTEETDSYEITPPLPPRPGRSIQKALPPSFNSSQIIPCSRETQFGRVETLASTPTSTDLSPPSSIPLTASSPACAASPSESSTSLYLQRAYREARHFAGGLISRPFESTKHFTVLRHSYGLVFYQGSNTSLTISIFADSTLPLDRTLWLQNKGWTGKTGMRAKAFIGRNGDWIDVTPSTEVESQQLKPSDEKAWQRDIATFRKKAHPKIREAHVLRETAVVRIPADADDGYFQVVLCAGNKKKVLCTSPVFRVFSASGSPSSIRGASLSTLPMELGAMVVSTYAANTIGRVISPVTSTVQVSVQRYMPSWWTKQACDVSGAGDRIKSEFADANNRYDQVRSQSLVTDTSGENVTDEAALHHGPNAPYPIPFVGQSQINLNDEAGQSNLPAFTLCAVDKDIVHKLRGYYFGWVCVLDKSATNESPWYQALISVLPIDPSQLMSVSIAQASRAVVTVRILGLDENISFDGTLFEIQVMGFIRPDEPVQRRDLARGLRDGDAAAAEAAMISEINDVSLALNHLGHPSWSPGFSSVTRNPVGGSSPLDKAKTAYANGRIATQQHMDRIPLHKAGIRTPLDKARDKMVVSSGLFIRRG